MKYYVRIAGTTADTIVYADTFVKRLDGAPSYVFTKGEETVADFPCPAVQGIISQNGLQPGAQN